MNVVPERPYPPTGITTAEWMATVPVVRVNVRSLAFVQTEIDLVALLTGRVREGSDAYPHVVRFEGVDYVEDGHVRIARHVLMLGTDQLLVRRFEA